MNRFREMDHRNLLRRVAAESAFTAEMTHYEKLQVRYQDALVSAAAHRHDGESLEQLRAELGRSKDLLEQHRLEIRRCEVLALAIAETHSRARKGEHEDEIQRSSFADSR